VTETPSILASPLATTNIRVFGGLKNSDPIAHPFGRAHQSEVTRLPPPPPPPPPLPPPPPPALTPAPTLPSASALAATADITLNNHTDPSPSSKFEALIEMSPQPQQSSMHVSSSLTSIPLSELNLISVLGGGAFGQVWRGSWRGTPVAVKMLSPVCQSALPEQLLKAFGDEGAYPC